MEQQRAAPTYARSVAIVGAGLGGLSAAYRLQRAGWAVTVFESESLVGGRVQTVAAGGYLADTGATAVGAGYPEYFGLAAELGLEVVPGPPVFGVYRDGRVRHLDISQPMQSGIGDLISRRAQLKLLRLAADAGFAAKRGMLDRLDMGTAAPLDTESVREYSQRRLDDELDAYVCGPIARIMELADSDKVSKAVLFTAVAGILKGQLSALSGGQHEMARALAELVPVRLSTQVLSVREWQDAVAVTYRDPQGTEREQNFDAAVVSCPLPAAVEICPDHQQILRTLSDRVHYNQTLVVSIGTTRPPNSPAYVVQMPTCEDDAVAALFLHHNKAPDRAPEGHGLLGMMWEQDAALRWMDRSDEEIVDRTLRTVLRVFPELAGTVDFTHVHRWQWALPLHDVGSFKQIREFNAQLRAADRVRFTGDYRAIDGQNSAIELGAREAAALDQALPLKPRRTPTSAGNARPSTQEETMSNPYRVIIWGPGSIGGYVLREALERPEFEVVGVRVFSESKNGVDIGELAGAGPVGIAATNDVDALIALDADCVIHTPQAFDVAGMDAEVIRLLESGKNVVSTAGYHFPPATGHDRASALEAACHRGGTSLMGAGLHPPFAVTALAMPLTGAMTEVSHIRLTEAADLARVLADMGAATNPLVIALGFGQVPEAMDPHDPAAVMVDSYYDEIARFIAHRLYGVGPDEVRTEHSLSGIATPHDYEVPSIPGYVIGAGTAMTVLRTQRAYIGDHHFFTNEDIWYLEPENQYLGAGHLPSADTAGAINYFIEISGKPAQVRSHVNLDDTPAAPPVVTSASVATLLQSVVPVCHAAPGFAYRDTVPRFARDLRTVAPATPATVEQS